MTIWKRLFVEHRVVIVPIVLGILANVAFYALVVYPKGLKSAGAADRARQAAAALREAGRAALPGKRR